MSLCRIDINMGSETSNFDEITYNLEQKKCKIEVKYKSIYFFFFEFYNVTSRKYISWIIHADSTDNCILNKHSKCS